jgi:hypothetical protein
VIIRETIAKMGCAASQIQRRNASAGPRNARVRRTRSCLLDLRGVSPRRPPLRSAGCYSRSRSCQGRPSGVAARSLRDP